MMQRRKFTPAGRKFPSAGAGRPGRPVTSTDLSNGAVGSDDLSNGAVGSGDLQNRPAGPVRPVRPKPSKPAAKPPKPAKPKPRPRPSSSSMPSRVVTRGGVQSSTRGGSGGAGGSSNGTPAPRRPKTFTDGAGVVRNVRPARRGTGPAKPAEKDPIASLVDEIIAGMNKPLEEQKRQVVEQSIGNITQTNRLAQNYDNQVGSLRQDANLDLGQAVAKAAELRGISQSTVAAHQDYLKGLMADVGSGGTAAAQVAESAGQTAGAVASASDSMAQMIASRGQNLNDYLAKQQVVGNTQQAEANQQELLRRSAAQRDLDGQMAVNRGQAAQMRHTISQAEREQDLKAMVAEKEWGLEAAKFQADDRYRYDKLGQDGAIAAARLEADLIKADAKASKPPAPGRYGNIPKRYDSAIKSVWTDLNNRFNSEEGLPAPWRTAHQALVDQGLDATAAAFLSTKWFADSITGSTPDNIKKLLANRGVSLAAQKRIITQYFGPSGWKEANDRPGLGAALDMVQSTIPRS